jgi:hypothetical protein
MVDKGGQCLSADLKYFILCYFLYFITCPVLHLDVHLMEMSPGVLLRTKARAVGFGLSLLSHPDCRTPPFAMGNEFNPAGG